MSVNEYRPHIFVLPEDDANRELANGFSLYDDLSNPRQIKVMPNAGGWTNVCDKFVKEYIKKMNQNSNTHLVLLVDFDQCADRLDRIMEEIPVELSSTFAVFRRLILE